MTISFPEGVDAQGNGKLVFVEAVADTSAPTLVELALGVDVSCAIEGFEATSEQGSSTDTRYCSTQSFQTPGKVSVDVSPLVYVYDPQEPDSAEYPWYEALAEGTTGYLVNRLGKAFDDVFAVGDVVHVYPCTWGSQNPVPIDASSDGGKLKISQKPFVTGPRVLDAVLVAGA